MFKLFFVTPDQKIVSDQDLSSIVVPAFRGQLKILEGHSPLMTTLSAGILTYKLKNGEEKKYAISWGYCQVSAEGVTVLAETATDGLGAITDKLKEEIKRVEKKLAEESLDDRHWDIAQNSLARTRAELELVSKAN
jgi:F-type H+-transporting ATPase subunit epsilon